MLLYASSYYCMCPHTTSSSVTGVYLDDFPIERVPKDELGMCHSFFKKRRQNITQQWFRRPSAASLRACVSCVLLEEKKGTVVLKHSLGVSPCVKAR